MRAQLGVGDRPWQSCDPGVYADFVGDFMRNYEARAYLLLCSRCRAGAPTAPPQLLCLPIHALHSECPSLGSWLTVSRLQSSSDPQ